MSVFMTRQAVFEHGQNTVSLCVCMYIYYMQYIFSLVSFAYTKVLYILSDVCMQIILKKNFSKMEALGHGRLF